MRTFYLNHIVAAFLIWLLSLGSVSAHSVDNMFLSFSKNVEADVVWKAEMALDVALAIPRLLDDEDAPQPGRQWLVDLSDAEFDEIRVNAAQFLRNTVTFSYNGSPIDYEISFPDFLVSPPDFPRLLNGGAYISVEFKGAYQRDLAGEFQLHVRSGKLPDVIVATADEGGLGEDTHYMTIQPGESIVLWADTASGADSIAASRGAFTLMALGYEHVIPSGLDHVLFILLLFLVARNWRVLLRQSLIFTLAHSVSLGLAVSGVIQMGTWHALLSGMVEPLIALSILCLAVENIFAKKVSRSRYTLIFFFGLVHGLGFAGSLGSVLSHGDHWVFPLAMANLGVELAQVSVLVVAWILTIKIARSKKYPRIQQVSSLIIAVAAAVMLFSRLYSLFS